MNLNVVSVEPLSTKQNHEIFRRLFKGPNNRPPKLEQILLPNSLVSPIGNFMFGLASVLTRVAPSKVRECGYDRRVDHLDKLKHGHEAHATLDFLERW